MSRFRKQYRELTDDEKARIDRIKTLAEQLETEMLDSVITGAGATRCSALARTNLEQAVMWAVKGITE